MDVAGSDDDAAVGPGQRVVPHFVPHVVYVQLIGRQHLPVALPHYQHTQHTNGQDHVYEYTNVFRDKARNLYVVESRKCGSSLPWWVG